MSRKNLLSNLILNTDGYKPSHYLQYPNGITFLNSYIESRGGRWENVLFFGLQGLIKEYLLHPISQEDIDFAQHFLKKYGVPFNKNGWQYILEKYSGYLPIQIEAVKEGMLIPNGNVLIQIRNTDPECAWLTSYIETLLLRIWYPCTVATLSYYCKQHIKKYREETGGIEGLPFSLHDFGARGVSSLESAAISGAAHLVNFMGSDTLSGILYAMEYYNSDVCAFSIPASEHTTITSWGKDYEIDAFKNMITSFPEHTIIACVSDSYDFWDAIKNKWPLLNQMIIDNKKVLVIRPDSGTPWKVVPQALEILSEKFGYTLNNEGYKILPDHIRIIQGDGINEQSIQLILEEVKNKGFSAANVTFGMGGALLQQVNRDTLSFAQKGSAILKNSININDDWIGINKDPVDAPNKKSKEGIFDVIIENNVIKTVDKKQKHNGISCLDLVYKNGKLIREQNFEEIRNLVAKSSIQRGF